jgi:hypothetical protein
MKNRNFSINIIFILLFLIISALFLIYIFRDINYREYFEIEDYSWKYSGENNCKGNLNTNTELLNRDSNFKQSLNRYDKYDEYNKIILQNPNNKYKNYCDIMSWQDLLAYRCLNKSPLELAKILDDIDISNTFETIYIYDENSLYSHLLSKIQKQKTEFGNNKIIGPVYVCISQAPYLKYINNNSSTNPIDKVLDARIDILNNRFPFYLENINSSGVQSFITNTSSNDEYSRTGPIISSLYCQILILYPLYSAKTKRLKETNKNEQTLNINNFLENTMKEYYTNNDLCGIRCNKSSQLNCGCLSYNNEEATENTYFNDKKGIKKDLDLPKYTAKCIDHTIRGKENTSANFSMMYFVNPYSDNYGDFDIIEAP